MEKKFTQSDTVFIGIEENDSGFTFFDFTNHLKVPKQLDDHFAGCFTTQGIKIHDYQPSSLDDLGAFVNDFEFYMHCQKTKYYIKKSFKTFLTELQEHKTANHDLKMKLQEEQYEQKIKFACEDETPMANPPFEDKETEYSASKTVTKKMKALSKKCWKKTLNNVNSIEIRDEMHQCLSKIWSEAPQIAEYDYEDFWKERDKFWSQFPASWKIVFNDTFDGWGGKWLNF